MANDQSNQSYIGALVMFLIIVLITVALFLVEVPAANQKVVGLLIGMFATNLGVVMFRILGRDPDEIKQKDVRIAQLEGENDNLRLRVDHLDKMFMELQSEVISKISLLSKG